MIEAIRARLIGPKTWDRIVGIFGDGLDSPRTVWSSWVMIYALIHGLVCMRPGMAMEFESTKKNRFWMSGLPTDSHLFCFGTEKTVPGLCEIDQKRPCVGCVKLMKLMA